MNSGIVYGTSEEESSSGIVTYSGGLVNFDDSSNYTYDNNGNIINNGKYKFIYDYKNRIIEVTNQDNETIVSYEYDILDRRYKKESNSRLVEYTFSNENILEKNITNSGNSTITKEYINGIGTDDLIAYDLDSVRYYFNLNHLGSVDSITDNSGTTLISYEYDSYGNTFVESSGSLVEISSYTGSTYENDRLYTGREFDREINLYYLRARYYDSKIGRFISRDPIDISDDVNLYAYVGNNPINYNDLEGEQAKEVIGNILDTLSLIDYEELKYDTGKNLRKFGIVLSATTAPACISSISVTGGCALVTAPGGVLELVCTPFAISAGASCGVSAIGGGIAAGGNYMMSTSGGSNGENNGTSRYVPKKTKDEVREKYGNKCVYCKTKTNTDKVSNPNKSEIDHKDPFVKSKNNDFSNLQNTCRTCNRKKGTMSDSLFRTILNLFK